MIKHLSRGWRRLPMFLFWLITCYPSDVDSLFNNKCNIIAAGLYSCQLVGTVNVALPFTKSVTIWISKLQKFSFWVATSNLRRLCRFYFTTNLIRQKLILKECLFWKRCDFLISFSGILMNRIKGNSMVGMGILSLYMKFPLSNVKWHSGGWPYTVTPSIDQTWHHILSCYWAGPYYPIWRFT